MSRRKRKPVIDLTEDFFDFLYKISGTSTLALGMIVGHLLGKDAEAWKIYSIVLPILQKERMKPSDYIKANDLMREFLISLGIKWR